MSEKDYTVPALQKGLRILEMFDSNCRALSQVEMAQRLGVSASSIYRIVQTLTSMGYLSKIGTNTYALGTQVVSRGFSYLASREIVEVAAPFITRLRDSTSLSSHVGVRDGAEVLYVFRALALQRVSVNVPVGTRFPLHTTAMGRALLLGTTSAELQTQLQGQRLDGYPKPAPQTMPELIALCEKERAQGWTRHYSDHSTALAVPIRNFTGQVIAAINISGPDPIMNAEGVTETLLSELKQTASDIMRQVGGI
ncbi:IclR family transcriptional regulator [Marinobacter salarius]|uniref:Pca regulon regulatory protein n=1 Tax=Marinobacter salarius TaxID=1420917 RepID=A0A1W6KEB2_9GAMM|nr:MULTISPECIES: IclR family transcriptional regulator [Marinobacter]ARM85756.1 Pca regulon regulatory protein [Marinobacter salarius]MBJ7301006.1 IclR family transcriptional regulator [Marinobacter salarius]HIO30154.1 IclR family transcriptional regulator [Marinobacter salarius]HIO98413.1 IclR family transcriptional regulator [Marinobacter salarius]